MIPRDPLPRAPHRTGSTVQARIVRRPPSPRCRALAAALRRHGGASIARVSVLRRRGVAFTRIVIPARRGLHSGNARGLDASRSDCRALRNSGAPLAQVDLMRTPATADRTRDRICSSTRAPAGFLNRAAHGESSAAERGRSPCCSRCMSHKVSEFARRRSSSRRLACDLTHPRLTRDARRRAIVAARRALRPADAQGEERLQDRVAERGESEELLADSHGQDSPVGARDRRYHQPRRCRHRAVRRARIRGSAFLRGNNRLTFCGIVAGLWQGGRLVLAGALTPGAIVSFSSTRKGGPRSVRSRPYSSTGPVAGRRCSSSESGRRRGASISVRCSITRATAPRGVRVERVSFRLRQAE